jgi:hypothetical protein
MEQIFCSSAQRSTCPGGTRNADGGKRAHRQLRLQPAGRVEVFLATATATSLGHNIEQHRCVRIGCEINAN